MWCGKQRGRCGERRDQVRAASQDWLRPEAVHVQKAVPTSLRSCATRWSDGYVVRSLHACTLGLEATCPHTAHAPAGSLMWSRSCCSQACHMTYGFVTCSGRRSDQGAENRLR